MVRSRVMPRVAIQVVPMVRIEVVPMLPIGVVRTLPLEVLPMLPIMVVPRVASIVMLMVATLNVQWLAWCKALVYSFPQCSEDTRTAGFLYLLVWAAQVWPNARVYNRWQCCLFGAIHSPTSYY